MISGTLETTNLSLYFMFICYADYSHRIKHVQELKVSRFIIRLLPELREFLFIEKTVKELNLETLEERNGLHIVTYHKNCLKCEDQGSGTQMEAKGYE